MNTSPWTLRLLPFVAFMILALPIYGQNSPPPYGAPLSTSGDCRLDGLNQFCLRGSLPTGIGPYTTIYVDATEAVGPDGLSLSFKDVQPAIEAALTEWNEVAHSEETFSLPILPFPGGEPENGASLITFSQGGLNFPVAHVLIDSTDTAGRYVSFTLYLSPLARWSPTEVYQELPFYPNPWPNSDKACDEIGAIDLQSIVAHELGHTLGLSHPDTGNASPLTMQGGNLSVCEGPDRWWAQTYRRSVEAGDQLGKIYTTPDLGRLATQQVHPHVFVGAPSTVLVDRAYEMGTGQELTAESSIEVASGEAFEVGPGSRLSFMSGTDLRIEGALVADGATFTEAQVGQGWGGIAVGGSTGNGTATFDGVTVEHAAVGVAVQSIGSAFVNSTFRYNMIGLTADYRTVCSGTCAVLRSGFDLIDSFVEGNDEVGLFLSDTDALIAGTSIRNNGEEGMTLWNASTQLYDGAILQTFRANYVENNGEIGVVVLDNAELEMMDDNFDSGLDRIAGNGSHELFVADGGYLFLGSGSIGGDNAIFDVKTPLGANNRLIYNEQPCSGMLCAERVIDAENAYWGSASGPPPGAFSGPVDASPFLTTDPTDPSARPALVDALARGDAGRGDGALGESIRHLRRTLVEAPGAEGAATLVRRLYALQRLDRANAHGEHAATMAALAALRGHLQASEIPDPLRASAEAALVATVQDAVRAEDYETARDLVGAFEDRIEGPQAVRALALGSVSLKEQAGRYDEALATLQGVIAGLDPKATPLAGALKRVVSELETKAGSGEGGRPGSTMSASASTRTDVSASVGLLPVYPNPARDAATVSLVLAESADVKVAVYDVLGRRVARLHEGVLAAGTSAFRFDGNGLPSGLYLVRVISGDRALTQQITLLK